MAREIFLSIFSKDFQNERNITENEWNKVFENILNIRKVDNDYFWTIETYSKELNDWVPVFSISTKGSTSIKENPFLTYEDVYRKGFQIAKLLNACISNEDFQAIYLPISNYALDKPIDIEKLQKFYKRNEDTNLALSEILEIINCEEKEANKELYNPIGHVFELQHKNRIGCISSIKIIILITLSFLYSVLAM